MMRTLALTVPGAGRAGEAGAMMEDDLNIFEMFAKSETPVHDSFGLTYASYLVYPRSVLERMPREWQSRFVLMLGELHDRLEYDEPHYTVHARKNGAFIKDELRNYRRPDRSLIRERKQP